MSGLKIYKILFVLAAVFFVAKPFVGFSITSQSLRPSDYTHSILTKIFSKRKPESLEDAEERVVALHHLLTHPSLKLLVSMAALLSLILPLVSKAKNITAQAIDLLHFRLIPQQQRYLLAGKLII